MSTSNRIAAIIIVFVLETLNLTRVDAHEGPDPVSHWYFTKKTISAETVDARIGPDATVIGKPKLVEDELGSALRFDGVQDYLCVAPVTSEVSRYLPTKYLTVASWLTVEAGNPQGAMVSTREVDGEAEKGWFLGYDDSAFRFGLSSRGADDGDGRMTIVRGATNFEPGKYYHVVGVYDGAEMRLYVNGRCEASSDQQSGEIYPPRYAPYVIGAAVDHDEFVCHQGLIRDVAIYDMAATEKWVTHEFEHGSDLLTLDAPETSEELKFLVPPYLQFVTQDGITVMCETTRPGKVSVRHGETGELDVETRSDSEGRLHEVRIKNLKAETPYYYKVDATDDSGRAISSQLLSFQTANKAGTPFTFGVLADTQENPRACKILSDMLWAQRPNFVIIPGDLVDSGPNKRQWVEQFFPGMQPLASRVAFFPVLGNHEENARHYYNYMSVPDPEYYYTFHYGNAQFFVLDSNKDVSPESQQYRWLEEQLTESTAVWKFVTYHHPAYSSDEDDYGDMWKGQRSSNGDVRLRSLVKLYDRFGVDIVWNGHIHSYERTWPLREEKVQEQDGTIYMITGGAGGQLETAGPVKPWFQNNVKHGHHYCLASVNGRILEFKAFDMTGRMFDYLKIDKRP
jgi:acid phosphatase type 7